VIFFSGVGFRRLMCSVSCKDGRESSDFMKRWKFLDELSN